MERKSKKFLNIQDFYNYIKNPLDEDKILQIYLIQGIKKELLDVCNDFILALTVNVYDTYLGSEYIKSDDEIKNHFDWCFKTVNDGFIKEGFDFTKPPELKEYFNNFFISSFYQKTDIINNEFATDKEWQLTHWNAILNYTNLKKSASDIDIMLDIYTYFEQSLKLST